jgi:hypothetical protein
MEKMRARARVSIHATHKCSCLQQALVTINRKHRHPATVVDVNCSPETLCALDVEHNAAARPEVCGAVLCVDSSNVKDIGARQGVRCLNCLEPARLPCHRLARELRGEHVTAALKGGLQQARGVW